MAENYQKWNSWGRTRGPKNLGGANGMPVNVLESTTPLKGITATTEGYDTENQRYLHVLVTDTDTDAPAATNVYGYCHAFQRWFAIPQSAANGAAPNAVNTASTIAAPNDSGDAPADQVPTDRQYRRYDIAGIDKVAFVNEDASEVAVFAACSTF